MKKCFATDATGFIGGRPVAELLRGDMEARVLARTPNRTKTCRGTGSTPENWVDEFTKRLKLL